MGIFFLIAMSRKNQGKKNPAFPKKTGIFDLALYINGSGGRARTYDQSVNSRLLYHWATPEQSVATLEAEAGIEPT